MNRLLMNYEDYYLAEDERVEKNRVEHQVRVGVAVEEQESLAMFLKEPYHHKLVD